VRTWALGSIPSSPETPGDGEVGGELRAKFEADASAIFCPREGRDAHRSEDTHRRHRCRQLDGIIKTSASCCPEGCVEVCANRCVHSTRSLAEFIASVPDDTAASNGFVEDARSVYAPTFDQSRPSSPVKLS